MMRKHIKPFVKKAFDRCGYTVMRSATYLGFQQTILSLQEKIDRASPPTPGAFYDLNGYFIFKGALSTDNIARLRQAVEQEVAENRSLRRHPSAIYAPNEYLSVPDGSGKIIVSNALLDPHSMPETPGIGRAIRELLCTGGVADLLASLDGEQSYAIYQTILFFVCPNTGAHVDAWGMDTAPPGYAHTLWFPLEPVSLLNGPLAILPWPRGALLHPDDIGAVNFAWGPDDKKHSNYFAYNHAFVRFMETEGARWTVPQLQPGDLVVFTSLTPHATLPCHGAHPSRMAMQVLVKPARRRWSPLRLVMAGTSNDANDGRLQQVNDRWQITGEIPTG